MRSTPFYIIGNWKSNKTVGEAVIWMQDFATLWKSQPYDAQKVKVILCASFSHLTTLASLIQLNNLPLELGAQNISPFPVGAYTGEVSAAMLKDLVRYTLVGHSERRKHFHEGQEDLPQKIKEAKSVGLTSIYCIQNETDDIPADLSFVAYEPVWAIGTGKPETAEAANSVAASIKQEYPKLTIIYGGSVTPENVAEYAKMEEIGGVLPGGASLKPDTFYNLILNANSV